MKRALWILAIIGGIAYLAGKAGASVKAQLEARKQQELERVPQYGE